MAVSEDKRLALRNCLIETLGEEEARTLMESLPPVPWERVATKDDIIASEERIRSELAAHSAETAAEFKAVRGETALLIANQTRTLVLILAGFMLTTWGSVLAFGIS